MAVIDCLVLPGVTKEQTSMLLERLGLQTNQSQGLLKTWRSHMAWYAVADMRDRQDLRKPAGVLVLADLHFAHDRTWFLKIHKDRCDELGFNTDTMEEISCELYGTFSLSPFAFLAASAYLEVRLTSAGSEQYRRELRWQMLPLLSSANVTNYYSGPRLGSEGEMEVSIYTGSQALLTAEALKAKADRTMLGKILVLAS